MSESPAALTPAGHNGPALGTRSITHDELVNRGHLSPNVGSFSATPALVLSGMCKTFGTRRVLDDVGFTVSAGEIHALIGGNGSGKSTLVKSLAGIQHADPGGTVQVGVETVAADQLNPGWARRHGLRFVHQNPGIFPTMTVADNVAMVHGIPSRGGLVRGRHLERLTRQLLDRFEVDVSPRARMGDLRLAEQTMVAIARALHFEDGEQISALILDEPTAALPEEEVHVLLDAIRRARRSGAGIVFISHRLEEVLAIADSVTVLRDGREVGTRPMAGLTEGDLVSSIVGTPLTELFPRSLTDSPPARVVAEARAVFAGPLRNVSLQARAGEILGVAGLLGSGRSELLQLFFGCLPPTAGSLLVDDAEVHFRSPHAAMDVGIAYVPEDRTVEAAFPDLSVRVNLSVADIPSVASAGHIKMRLERSRTADAMSAFRVRASSGEALMSSLSGGNQQKVVLARWLARSPKLLLLDEPTQGVDVGARADAFALIRAAVDEGTAAILVSSDFEELAEMSDRVIVLREGRIVAEVTGSELTRHRLTELAFLAGKDS